MITGSFFKAQAYLQQQQQERQLKDFNAVVRLVDCMKCYIRIPRCEIPVITISTHVFANDRNLLFF